VRRGQRLGTSQPQGGEDSCGEDGNDQEGQHSHLTDDARTATIGIATRLLSGVAERAAGFREDLANVLAAA
jgi:hypothetical protein